MPEVTGEANITIVLTEEDLTKLQALKLNDGHVLLTDGKWAKRTKDGEIVIESEEEVTLEFEMSDYAPERDEC